jgi:hypothetical protein
LFGLIRQLRKRFSSKETENLIEKVKEQLKVVYKEQVGDVHYLYEKTTNSFVAQGLTEDEMWANAHLTFPTQEFIIEGENGKAVLVSVKDTK